MNLNQLDIICVSDVLKSVPDLERIWIKADYVDLTVLLRLLAKSFS